MNTLIPVTKHFLPLSEYTVSVFTYSIADQICLRENIPFISLEQQYRAGLTENTIKHLLIQERPDVVISSTSSGQLENMFRGTAKHLHIPTIVIIDQWLNYSKRFKRDEMGDAYLPDVICVLDEIARADMIAEGFPPDSIRITGNPYLDDIFLYAESYTNDKINTFRESLGITPDEQVIIFASEPIENSIEDNPGIIEEWGFSEKTVFKQLLIAVNAISQRRHLTICVVIKFHPHDNTEKFDRIIESYKWRSVRVIKNNHSDPRELILSSQLVAGMTSIFLIEAVLMGKLIVSLQPGTKKTNKLITERVGASIGIYNSDDMEPMLEKLLCDTEYQQKILEKGKTFYIQKSATHKIVAEILAILK
jgi:hypothetical protein